MTGSRHFDAHAYRTADADDVKAFARGCMRTYLILKEKARRFAEDAEIQGLLSQIHAQDADFEPYSRESAQALSARDFDRQALGARPALRGARPVGDRTAPGRALALSTKCHRHGCPMENRWG